MFRDERPSRQHGYDVRESVFAHFGETVHHVAVHFDDDVMIGFHHLSHEIQPGYGIDTDDGHAEFVVVLRTIKYGSRTRTETTPKQIK